MPIELPGRLFAPVNVHPCRIGGRAPGLGGAAEPHVAGHVAFLERHHAAGTFVLSGQAVPSSEGGLIIAVGVDRQGAEEIAAEDPFVKAGVARYRITTVAPGRAHPALARLWR